MKFLEEIAGLNLKNENHIKDSGVEFNLFNILDRATDEVKTHSALIGELLNLDGKHNKGNAFFILFLRYLKGKAKNETEWKKAILPNEEEIDNLRVEIEKYIGKVTSEEGGFIDIVLSNRSFTLCIENKIDASDQPNQLTRYSNFLKNRHGKRVLIYLTKYGEESNESSLEAGSDYFCLSYENDIISWLEECLHICTPNESILSSSIRQYIYLLKQLTNQVQTNKVQKEIHSKILENIKASQTIVAEFGAALNLLSTEIRGKVCEELKERLNINDIKTLDTGNNFSTILIPLPNQDVMIGIESFTGKGHEGGALFIGKIDFDKKNKEVDYKYSFWYRNTIRTIWGKDRLFEKYQSFHSGNGERKAEIIDEIVLPICEFYRIEVEK